MAMMHGARRMIRRCEARRLPGIVKGRLFTGTHPLQTGATPKRRGAFSLGATRTGIAASWSCRAASCSDPVKLWSQRGLPLDPSGFRRVFAGRPIRKPQHQLHVWKP